MGLLLGPAMMSGSSSSSSSSSTNPLATNPLNNGNVLNALSTAASLGANYTTTPSLPSWLSTNTDSEVGDLEDTYKTVPAAITSAANSAASVGNEAANMAYGQQMRQGANATQQMSNVSRQQGGTAKTSSIVAGEMTEDAAKQRTDSRLQIAQMQLGAQENAASLSSQIASSIGSLRTSYLNTLANVSDTNRQQDMSYSQNALNYGLQADSAAKSSASSTAGGAASSMTYTGMRGAGLGSYGGASLQTMLPGYG